LKVDEFSCAPKSALGTVDRFCLSGLFSVIYEIDHLSKQQVVSSDDADRHWSWRLSLVETCGPASSVLTTLVDEFGGMDAILMIESEL